MPQLIIVADDLTGAADTGGVFAALGLSSVVRLGGGELPPADVLVVSTESRACDPAEAISRVGALASPLPELAATPWIYKKIDSTLRGHPAVELRVLREMLAWPTGILVAPAFPAQGRFTRQGQQWVGDGLLSESPFGSAGSSSSVLELFAREFGRDEPALLPLELIRSRQGELRRQLGRWSGRLLVADAETDDDLRRVSEAAVASGIRLFCGSSGLASALARVLPWSLLGQPDSASAGIGQGGVLAIAGSRHPQTLRQVARCASAGVPVVAPGQEWLGEPDQLSRVSTAVGEALGASGCCVLSVHALPILPGHDRNVASRLADTLAEVQAQRALSGLITTGGDVAFACSHRLQAAGLRLRGEVERGIPWGQFLGGRASGIAVVTKAGGFGSENTLLHALRFLESKADGA